MSIMLHKGAELIEPDTLRTLVTPEGTTTHAPIAHIAVVEMVKYALGFYGHEIVEEHHAVTEDELRYFGVISLKSPDGLYTDTVGLRNSHDKSFPIGIAFGSRVFVCDNLAFSGDHVIKRRHTPNAKRDLPALVAEVVEPLKEHRALQHEKLSRYQETPLDDRLADHVMMEMYRNGIINLQRIATVNDQWNEPMHEEWGNRTAWRMFNAATYALSGRVSENPGTTAHLHQIIDGAIAA